METVKSDPIYQINQNSIISANTPTGSTSTTSNNLSVQANIAQSAHQAVKQYPINTTLIKSDINDLLSNLTIDHDRTFDLKQDPNLSQSHIETSLQVLEHSINPSNTIDPHHRCWALSQLQFANHLINHQIRENANHPLTFKDPPYALPIGHPIHQQAHQSCPENPAQFHAGLLHIPLLHSLPHSASLEDPPSTSSLRQFYQTAMVTATSFEASPPSEPTTNKTSTLLNPSSPLTKQSSSVPNSPRPDPFETPKPAVRFKLKSESPDPLALPTSRSSSTISKNRHKLPTDFNSTPQLKRRKMDKFNAYVATSPHTQPRLPEHSSIFPFKADDRDLGILPKSTPTSASVAHPVNSPGLPNPAARLASVVEDILEADDMRQGTDSTCEFFVVNDGDPILNPKVLSKMTKLIEHGNGDCLLDISGDDMSRLMKLLEKGVKAFEEIVVVPSKLKILKPPRPSSLKSSSKSKRGTPSKSSSKSCVQGSGSPDINGAPHNPDYDSTHHMLPPNLVADNHIKIIQGRMDDMLNALHSVDFMLLLLSCEKKLPKRFCSEETISMITRSLKHQLHTVVYPFMQTGQISASDAYSTRLEHVLSKSNATRQAVSSIFSIITTSVLPKINLLVTNLDLPESILNHLNHICISSFLFEPQAAFSASTRSRSSSQNTKQATYSHGGIAGMRLECLNLLRNISSKYPAQTDGIVDEVLSSIANVSGSFVSSPILGSGSARYQLSHGKSIHSISALLLHIIQCSAHGTRARLRSKLRSLQDGQEETKVSEGLSTNDSKEAIYQVVKDTVEPVFSTATQLGTKIIRFLSEKSTKSSKSNNESNYRLVFDQLVSDSIDLLYLPDWPVAEFLLGLFCKKMVDIWEETKTMSADRNAIKVVFIDHMGHIAARLFRPYPTGDTDGQGELAPREQAPNLFKTMLKTGDLANLSQFFQSQASLILRLDGMNTMEDETNSASDFLHAQWSMEFMKAIRSLRSEQQMEDAPPSVELQDFLKEQLHIFCSLETRLALDSAVCHRLDPDPVCVNPGSLLESVSQIQGLKLVRDLLLDRIILASATSVVTFRSKAIKALGLVVAQDETIFYRKSVRTAIEERMLDSSPAVRDAVMDLIGKYVTVRPNLAITFLPRIAVRIADKGLSVRRRVVKLLKSIYQLIGEDHVDLKVEISRRLMSRMYDEDMALKELAMDGLGELWFAGAFNVHTVGTIMMQLTAHDGESTVSLEEAIKFILRGSTKIGASVQDEIRRFCQTIVDHLIDEMMNGGMTVDNKSFSEGHCIKTIYAIASVSPRMLSPNKAMILLPYLKGATTADEQMTIQYLLKLFKACVIDTPKLSYQFCNTLQAALLPALNKPNLNDGVMILQERVSCFCAVVIHQTQDFPKLIKVFKACEQRLREWVVKLDRTGTTNINLQPLLLLMYLVSMLTAYGQLDELAVENEDIRNEIKGVGVLPLHVHVYQCFVRIFHMPRLESVRHITVNCLGYLYRTYPTLMTEPESTKILDQIFADPSLELRSRLLKLIAEFLASQTDKSEAMEDKSLAPITNTIDMDQLIGNTDNFADSGVGLAIVQRYLPQITTFAQSVDGPMQKAAVDIIACTIKQGLAHPMSCIPVLVALESSSDQTLAKRVFGLHTLLHIKRPDLVHTRFLEVMREVYKFYSRTSSSVSGYFGNPARSVIAPWYTLLSQKRAWRLDLIRSLIKSFSVDPLSSTVEIDDSTIDFNRFLCEAILTIDFKTQEEVLTLVDALNLILGQYAYQVLDVLEGGMTMKMLDGEDENEFENDVSEDMGSKSVAIRASVVLGMVFRLRDRVKILYGLTDQKCSKFSASSGKKSKMGDTAAVRRSRVMEEDKENFENGLSSSFMRGKLESKEDMLDQVKTFEKLVRDDAILGKNAADEDEDDMMMEE